MLHEKNKDLICVRYEGTLNDGNEISSCGNILSIHKDQNQTIDLIPRIYITQYFMELI